VPVVNVPYFVAIECFGTSASVFAGDSSSPTASAAAGITAADGLLPVISFKKSDANSSNLDVDFIVTWSARLG
jgi:hypothetical protein